MARLPKEPAALAQGGGPPNPLEQVIDGRGVVTLVLDLPPGSELPLLS
jgi:hypothetical protein